MNARFEVLPLLVIGCVALSAQVSTIDEPVTGGPRFEVASVKRNVSGRAGATVQVPPVGTVTYTNVLLRLLIHEAYQIGLPEAKTFDAGPYVRLVGKVDAGAQPDVPRFDVRGTPPDGTQPAERHAMMRALLEDRFKLRVHRESRRMPVYVLRLAKPGRLGPNLAPSIFDCRAYYSQRRYGGSAREPLDATGRSWCPNFVEASHPGVVIERSAGPTPLLVERLQNRLDRPLIDETGLSGNLEWTLTFGAGPDAPDDLPLLFTAIQEQLGLRIDSRQGAVDVLVIDHVELPTPD